MKKWLLAILFLPLTYLHAEDKQLPFTNFSGGLNSYFSPITIDDNQVKSSLNVLFDEDNAVTKRKGFTNCGSSKTYSYDSGWSYTDSTNTTWLIVRSSDTIMAGSSPCTFTVKIATVSANNTVNAVNAFGKIYFVDQTQGVYSWNGTVTTYIAGSPLGSLIAEFRNRIWVAGLAVPNGNQLYASKYLDGSTWTTGSLSTDPFVLTVGLQDNFDNISALFSGYNDTLTIFKIHSIYAVFGFDQTDFSIRVLNREVGCVDQRSIQPYMGGLIFVSLRGVEAFDGFNSTLISKVIKNKVDPAITISGFSTLSWVQSSQADWTAGTLNQTSATISPPTLVVSTQAIFSTTTAHWAGNTVTSNMDSTTNPPYIQLAQTAISTSPTSTTGGTAFFVDGYAFAQSFITDNVTNMKIVSMEIYLGANFGTAGSGTMRIKTDSGGTPGSDLATMTFLQSTLYPSGFKTFTLSSPLAISANTKYWVYFDAMGSTSDSNRTWTSCNPSCYASNTGWNSNSGVLSSFDFKFKVNYSQFQTAGSFTSEAFDVGTTTSVWLFNWGNFGANSTLNGGAITYQTQSSPDGVSFDSPVSVTDGAQIGSTPRRYIRYTAAFSGSASASPVLTNVTVPTSQMQRSSGTFRSQVHSVGSIGSWGNFSVVENLNNGSIAFSICSSANSGMTSSSCANQTINSQITISTGAYVQWYATFTVTNATSTLNLQSGTVQWFSGSRAVPMSSIVYDNRYWLALTTSTTLTSNNAVIILTKGPVWSIFDMPVGAFVLYKTSLYHMNNQANGKGYLDWQGYNDDGASINAFIQTKNFMPDGWMVDKVIKSLHLLAEPLGVYTLNSSYELDRSGTFYAFDDVTLDEFSGKTSLNLYVPKSTSYAPFGKSLSVRFGNNVVDQPMKIYGGNLVYSPRVIVQ